LDLQAFIITFREALEALLIVGIIVTYLKRVDHAHWNKWVWFGVVLALFASFGVALVFQVVLTGFNSMASDNYLRVGIQLISAALLTHMIMFLAKQNTEFEANIQKKVQHIITAGGIINMIVHSFLVVLREGIETVFFFAAISGGHIEKALTSWGALIGLIAACGLAYYFFKGTKRVPLGIFFKATSVLLMVIAAGFIVQAIGVLQDMKVMGTMYRTPGGEIGEVYNIVGFMPEHPVDEEQYVRDTGDQTIISGDVGIFFMAFLGYTHNPSVEQFAAYWLYFLTVYIMLSRKKKKTLADIRQGKGIKI
jgi:high-affinity iron transporter